MMANQNKTDRLMSTIGLVILSLGGCYAIYSLGPPVYWRFYATVIRPFEDHGIDPLGDDPFSSVLETRVKSGGGVHQKPHAPSLDLETHAKNFVGKPSSAQPVVETVVAVVAKPAGAAVLPAVAKPAVGAAAKPAAGGAAAKPAAGAAAKPAAGVVTGPAVVVRREAAVVTPVAAAVTKPAGPFKPEAYVLDKARAMKYSERGYVMVTWANNHYLDFAISWVANIQKIGLKGYLVGAMDDEVLQALAERDVNTWRMNTGLTKKDLGWGSANFHQMGRWKIKLIKQFLDLEVMVIISDIDTAWMRNPLPYFDRFPAADVLTSSDELRPTVTDESLERFPQAGSAFNIGIMLFRLSSKVFVDAWIKLLDDPKMWDQSAFNDLSRIKHGQSDNMGLWKGFNNTLTFGVLPVSLFASGHVFFVQRKHTEFGLQAFVAHATFQFSGTPGKRHRFREALLWSDPPSYFDHAVGFLRFDMDIPADMLARANGTKGDMYEADLWPHFDLVNHQLLRIRNAIAVAQITGRVLVVPPIMCALDKYWGPLLDGNIPGSKFHKPFICPMDHILDLEGGWAPKKPLSEFGPHVEWREYSFFQNPRLTKAVNDSRIRIEVCASGSAGCTAGGAPDLKSHRLKLSSGMDSSQLSAALLGLKQYKVLDFTSMAGLFTRFVEEAAQTAYVRRLKHGTSVFCCVKAQPGWIWYDFLWDQPHTDRMNRHFDKWHYKRGDQQTPQRRLLLAAGAEGVASTARQTRGVSLGGGNEAPDFLQLVGQQAMLSVP